MPPDERRRAILRAVLPVVRERGADVTTRELAEAAGVAEGTLFRVF
ncbi:MAG: TetR family transcriptional regulator, partial [Cellulomonas sp.]|nr:TetR family transcriptional regulator [Cellulomonas sp.]